jgi:hypothetical protein
VSTSRKVPATIRQGGPGASHQNAKTPLQIKKRPVSGERRRKSAVSGGGGERDSHHSHEPERKDGGIRPARKPDIPEPQSKRDAGRKGPARKSRKNEFGNSGGGSHQEDRGHNKHNEPGQSGHKPQQPSPAQEKHLWQKLGQAGWLRCG